jgi:hypothetical protein
VVVVAGWPQELSHVPNAAVARNDKIGDLTRAHLLPDFTRSNSLAYAGLDGLLPLVNQPGKGLVERIVQWGHLLNKIHRRTTVFYPKKRIVEKGVLYHPDE